MIDFEQYSNWLQLDPYLTVLILAFTIFYRHVLMLAENWKLDTKIKS